jgi:hypothetical protein
MGKFTVEAENNELVLKNSSGDHVIIPAKNRSWVQKKLQEGCHDCIDRLVESLPVAKEYAAKGTVIPAKAPTGPPTGPPVIAPPVMDRPTYADSLALYENAVALRDFYERSKQYAADPTRRQPISTVPKRLEQSLAGMQNKETRGFRTNVIVDGKRQSVVVPVTDFNKPVVNNPNQYLQREIENSVINMNAPMALIDKRIPPNMVQFYREKTNQNPDLVTVATYDPEKIRPKAPPIPVKPPVQNDSIPVKAPIVPPKPTPAPKKEVDTEAIRRLLKSNANTGRVSFGTSNNRPMNGPGPAGRGGHSNRLDGQGAVPRTLQRFLELFKKS